MESLKKDNLDILFSKDYNFKYGNILTVLIEQLVHLYDTTSKSSI